MAAGMLIMFCSSRLLRPEPKPAINICSAYQIELQRLCGVLAVAIAWLTVSFQAIKAALIDPVDALRYE